MLIVVCPLPNVYGRFRNFDIEIIHLNLTQSLQRINDTYNLW